MNNTTAAATKKSGNTRRSKKAADVKAVPSPTDGKGAVGGEATAVGNGEAAPVGIEAYAAFGVGGGEAVAAGGQATPDAGQPRVIAAPIFSTPPKNSFLPGGGGAWLSPSGKQEAATRTELDPPVVCDRCGDQHLVKNSAPTGKRVAFATCKDATCAGGGIVLFWATD
eukprot:jgi/Undpi1/7506/HiC_scaffold_22.g09979.m1